MHRFTPLALAMLVVLSGCSGLVPAPGDPGGTPGGPTHTVTVTEVVDGDTITVRFANGTTDTVRLLGIDTPETRADSSPDEFEGVPDTVRGRACLHAAGENATRYLMHRVANETVQLTTDPAADTRDTYGRLLAYVAQNGTDITYRLVATGHARVYDSTFSKADAFYAAEARAQANRTGVWACRRYQ